MGLSTTISRLSIVTSFVRLREGGAMITARLCLASMLVAVVSSSMNLVVIFIIFIVCCTTMIANE